MVDMLAQGEAWLTDWLKDSASRVVTYTRGAVALTLFAAVGESSAVADGGGAIVEVQRRDYLFPAADLAPLFPPQEGDTISDGAGVYTVRALPGLPPFRWCDSIRSRLRVHTEGTA